MDKPNGLSLPSIRSLVSLDAAYLLGYSWLFGMSIWVHFLGRIISARVLSKQAFGKVGPQKAFPIYSFLAICLSSMMLFVWTSTHPDVLTYISRPYVVDVAQAYTIATILLAQAANLLLVARLTNTALSKRIKLEKDEGKSFHEPGISSEMKSLNARIANLQNAGSWANLLTIGALLFHGLWIGNYGLRAY